MPVGVPQGYRISKPYSGGSVMPSCNVAATWPKPIDGTPGPPVAAPAPGPVESALAALDLDALSPREALEALYTLQKLNVRDTGPG